MAVRSITARLLLAAVLSVFAVGSLTACNTTKGVGEDVEAAGDALKDAAD